MQRMKRISNSMAALLFALSFTVAVPVYAESGSGSSGGGTDDTSQTTTTNTTETEHSGTNTETERPEKPELQHGGTKQDRLKRQEQLAERKSESLEHKSEKKQKSCEAHKKGLTTKFSRISTNSDRIKSRIDDVFAKAQQYQTTNNITVDNSLVTNATTAQQAAADAIANLKTVTPTIDCNNVSVASDVANFKVAATKTRDALKDYRTAVRNYLKALKEAKAATTETTTTTGGSND